MKLPTVPSGCRWEPGRWPTSLVLDPDYLASREPDEEFDPELRDELDELVASVRYLRAGGFDVVRSDDPTVWQRQMAELARQKLTRLRDSLQC